MSNSETTSLARSDLFDRNPSPMWIYDVATLQILEINEAALRVYGFAREEFLAKRIPDLLPAEDRPAVHEVLLRSSTGLYEAGIWRHLRSDGSVIHVEIVACDLAETSRPTRMVVAHDVTKTVTAEVALRRQAAILQAVSFAAAGFLGSVDWRPVIEPVFARLGAAGDVSRVYLFTVDEMTDDDVVFTQRFEWTAAHATPEIANETMQRMSFREEGFEQWLPDLRAGRAVHGHVRQFPERMRAFLGSQDIRTVLVVPIMVESVLWGFLGFDECRAERSWSEPEVDALRTASRILGAAVERSELEKQLLHSQKLQAVGLLASGVAHDFNNVLAVIFAHCELAQRHLTPANEKVAADVTEIRAAAGRATALTRQLLSFSRADRSEPRAIDVNSHVAELGAMVRRLLGEHVSVEVRLEPDVGAVHMDPVQLEQVLVNLAVNARDAMPNGGTLTISTARAAAPAPTRDASTGVVEVRVRDTGTGIPAAIRERVFEPFFTTKPPGRGTGLGLAMVRRAVHAVGGSVAIESEVGCGTEVVLRLPRLAPAGAEVAVGDDEPAQRGLGETILLVEDNDALRRAVATILREHGYEAVEAADGAEALARVAELGDTLGVVVTDISLPGMSGVELGRRIRERSPGAKLIYCTGYADDALAPPELRAGALPLLHKPYAHVTLLRAIASLLAR